MYFAKWLWWTHNNAIWRMMILLCHIYIRGGCSSTHSTTYTNPIQTQRFVEVRWKFVEGMRSGEGGRNYVAKFTVMCCILRVAIVCWMGKLKCGKGGGRVRGFGKISSYWMPTAKCGCVFGWRCVMRALIQSGVGGLLLCYSNGIRDSVIHARHILIGALSRSLYYSVKPLQ